MYGHTKIPNIIWIIVFFAIAHSLIFSINIFLISLTFLFIPFAYRLFFIKGDSNIIFWGVIFQWLIISIQLIYITIFKKTFDFLFNENIFPVDLLPFTNLLSIIGNYFFTLGIFFALKKKIILIPEKNFDEYNPSKMLILYSYVFFVSFSLQVIIWSFPSFVQYIYFLLYIKWGFFLAMFKLVYKKRKDLFVFVIIAIIIDFTVGLSSYFASSFYLVLVFTLIAFASINKKISAIQIAIVCISAILLFHIAVLWTAAKGNYRTYLNQGQNTQAVNVSREQAREKLFELILKIDDNTYQRAIVDVINRIGYIQYFSAAIRYVPNIKPFQNGNVYKKAIQHYLVPRFLNPNKPELDDSKHTNEYTGLNLGGKAQATSFSLGTFADAYIDFGPIYMFIPIFLLGLGIGFIFNRLYTNDIWGIVFTTPFFLLIPLYGTDTAKAIGAILIYSIVLFVFNKLIRKTLDPFIRVKINV